MIHVYSDVNSKHTERHFYSEYPLFLSLQSSELGLVPPRGSANRDRAVGHHYCNLGCLPQNPESCMTSFYTIIIISIENLLLSMKPTLYKGTENF